MLMDFTSTITESVRRCQSFQSLVMLVSSLTVEKDAALVQLDANHAQAPLSVLPAHKTDSVLSTELVELSVETD